MEFSHTVDLATTLITLASLARKSTQTSTNWREKSTKSDILWLNCEYQATLPSHSSRISLWQPMSREAVFCPSCPKSDSKRSMGQARPSTQKTVNLSPRSSAFNKCNSRTIYWTRKSWSAAMTSSPTYRCLSQWSLIWLRIHQVEGQPPWITKAQASFNSAS